MQNKGPYMQSLTRFLSRMVKVGYTEKFMMTNKGLFSPGKRKHYGPYEAQVVTKSCFESPDNSGMHPIIYVIETDDGIKGTWVDE